jgi:repressor LexA
MSPGVRRREPDRRQRILQFIQQYTELHGRPPTIREIQLGLGISSTSIVDHHVRALEREGLIRRHKGISRGIALVEHQMGELLIHVPLVGQIAAGVPISVPDDAFAGGFAETVAVDASLVPRDTSELFALRVKGHSMVDALIDDGDVVILRRQSVAENGEMVAVWLKAEGETTLKRFYREGTRVRLQPANVTMSPIYADADDVEIQGKVVAVIRRL